MSEEAQAARPLGDALAAALLLLVVGWTLGMADPLGAEGFMGLALALATACALLERGTARGVSAADAPALLALAALAALAMLHPALQLRVVRPDAAMLALGATALTAVVAATWRRMGAALPVVLGLLALFVLLVGPTLPERFSTRAVEPARVAAYLAFDTNGLMSRMLYIATATIAPFVLFGGLFAASGAGKALTAPLQKMLRGCHGGSSKAAVLGSAVFGMVSGSAVANVTTSGPVTIPMMVRDGVPPHEAAAVEAMASTNGQMTPPVMGASAFLMAEWLGLPYAQVALAATAPALLSFAALILFIDFIARAKARRPQAAPQEAEPIDWPGLGLALAPFVVLGHALFVAGLAPGRAAVLGCATLALIRLALAVRSGLALAAADLARAALASAPAVVGVVLLAACAALIMGLLNVSGAGFMLTVRLIDLAGGAFAPLAAMTAALAMLLGLGMPTVGVYLVSASLCAPALIAAGAQPLAAHMFILGAGMLSMITPPVALASFTAAMIAHAAPWRTAVAAMRLGVAPLMVSWAVLIQPALLDPLSGPPFVAALAAVAAALALLTAAMAGHVGAPMGPLARLTALALAAANLTVAGGGPSSGAALAAPLAGAAFLVAFTGAGRRRLVAALRGVRETRS